MRGLCPRGRSFHHCDVCLDALDQRDFESLSPASAEDAVPWPRCLKKDPGLLSHLLLKLLEVLLEVLLDDLLLKLLGALEGVAPI